MSLIDPIKHLLIDTRDVWDHEGAGPDARENFRKLVNCKTAALGWELYASETEEKRVCHTCKARPCPSCGYRATLSWLREQCAQLPDVRYAGVVLTMPDVLWPIFKRNRHLLRDLPTIGAEAISLWMKEQYGVRPLILVVQHTFGRHLDFKPHLHILMSAGGLSESSNCWIGRVTLNHVGFMRLWRYAVITYLRRALRAGILESDLKTWELKTIFAAQYERYWHSYLDHISKDHFLGYVARYIRRVPIAQRRIESIDGPDVKFWTKDTKTAETVLDTLSKEEFVKSLVDHTPDKYQNAIRYYGGLAPRSKSRTFALTLALLGKKRHPRPRRLGWAPSIMRYFGRNPLIDSRGKPMAFVGRYCPGQA